MYTLHALCVCACGYVRLWLYSSTKHYLNRFAIDVKAIGTARWTLSKSLVPHWMEHVIVASLTTMQLDCFCASIFLSYIIKRAHVSWRLEVQVRPKRFDEVVACFV